MSTRQAAPAEPETVGDDAVDVALRDGSSIHLRPFQSTDREAIRAFFEGLSTDSMCFRFFGIPSLDWVVKWSLRDDPGRYSLVATTGPDGVIVAHGVYIDLGGGRAEVSFVVADAWQGHGIATIMLAQLAAAAQQREISGFTAAVMPENHRMIQVFRDSGFPVEVRAEEGVIQIELPTSLSPAAQTRFDERERLSAIAAVGRFLQPRSVAVIGASLRRGTVGAEVLNNLITGGFTGKVYAVNPGADPFRDGPAYASIADVPQPVDLAVVVAPGVEVAEIALGCAAAGVHAMIVTSAGFAEAGAEGLERQERLLAICRESGMRLIGPNCVGVLNTDREVRLNATSVPHAPPAGNVGFFSQSGGVGIAVLAAVRRLGLGISSFVSVGNKADISGNDLLEYWEHDAASTVVLLYLESFGNPRRFARIARRVSAGKPIVAVKGRAPAGARATTSRTGALISASDVTVDALFEQAGVIRADTMHESLDVVSLLSAQPRPKGDRVAIITNAVGPGTLCADACRANGLASETIATATASDYRRAIEVLTTGQACDAIITIFVPRPSIDVDEVAAEIVLAARTAGPIPVASVVMDGSDGNRHRTEGAPIRIPCFPFPEDAAKALAHALRYERWRVRSAGVPAAAPTGCRPDEAAAIIARELDGGGGWLGPSATRGLLDCYGLSVDRRRVGAAGAEPDANGVKLLIGVVNDESFGPVIACGAGGANAEVLKDVAVRITPLSGPDAADMVRSLRTFPLLEGYDGAPACALAAIEDVLGRVSALVEAHPQIAELDLHPVIAHADGASILDACVRIQLAPAPRPPLALSARRKPVETW